MLKRNSSHAVGPKLKLFSELSPTNKDTAVTGTKPIRFQYPSRTGTGKRSSWETIIRLT